MDQLPSDSMALALYPVMKALIGKELVGHMETDVRMRVGSCLSEITRITAPTNPYKDDLMKVCEKFVVWFIKPCFTHFALIFIFLVRRYFGLLLMGLVD